MSHPKSPRCDQPSPPSNSRLDVPSVLTRRRLLAGSGAALAGVGAWLVLDRDPEPPSVFVENQHEDPQEVAVVVADGSGEVAYWQSVSIDGSTDGETAPARPLSGVPTARGEYTLYARRTDRERRVRHDLADTSCVGVIVIPSGALEVFDESPQRCQAVREAD